MHYLIDILKRNLGHILELGGKLGGVLRVHQAVTKHALRFVSPQAQVFEGLRIEF
jgi:hypothetical protein